MTAHRLPARSARWFATGGAVVLAGVVGTALVLQAGKPVCAAPPSTSTSSGKATFYDLGSGGTGNCSFAKSPADGLFVALGPSQYSSAAACGSYLDVTGPKGKVRVKVTDSCPECEAGHLDLSRAAFKKIANEVDGIVPITYSRVVNPSVPGSLSFRVKEGSSQYWLAVLADNHGNPLSSVQVAGPGGSFKSAARQSYNYWVIDGGAGSGPFRIKVTDVTGKSVTVSDIKLSPGAVQSSGTALSAGKATAKPRATSTSVAAKVEAAKVEAAKAKAKVEASKKAAAKAAAVKKAAAQKASAAPSPTTVPVAEPVAATQPAAAFAGAPVSQKESC